MAVFDPSNVPCWVILASAVVTGTVSLAGLVSPKYQDTFIETVALSLVSLMSLVVVAQIYELGYARMDGVASLVFSIALYSVAQGLKFLPRSNRRSHS